jgi:hypothetical protein
VQVGRGAKASLLSHSARREIKKDPRMVQMLSEGNRGDWSVDTSDGNDDHEDEEDDLVVELKQKARLRRSQEEAATPLSSSPSK